MQPFLVKKTNHFFVSIMAACSWGAIVALVALAGTSYAWKLACLIVSLVGMVLVGAGSIALSRWRFSAKGCSIPIGPKTPRSICHVQVRVVRTDKIQTNSIVRFNSRFLGR